MYIYYTYINRIGKWYFSNFQDRDDSESCMPATRYLLDEICGAVPQLTPWKAICAMVKVVAFHWGWDGRPTFNDGILIMGPYKPLRTWVDEFIPYYMEIMGV